MRVLQQLNNRNKQLFLLHVRLVRIFYRIVHLCDPYPHHNDFHFQTQTLSQGI